MTNVSWLQFEIWYRPSSVDSDLLVVAQVADDDWSVIDPRRRDEAPLLCGTYARARLLVVQQGYRRVEGRVDDPSKAA